MKPSACKGCPYEDVGGGFIPPDKHGAKLVSWGEAGGKDEERLGRGFVGMSGKKLRTAESRVGLTVWRGYDEPMDEALEEVLHNNTVLCRPPGNKFPGYDIARECLRRHQNAALLRSVVDSNGPGRGSGDIVLRPGGSIPVGEDSPGLAGHLGDVPWIAFGANATEALTGWRLPPLKIRGSLLPVKPWGEGPTKWVLSSIHPAFLLRAHQDEEGKSQQHLFPFLCSDIFKAMRYPEPRVPRVQCMSDPAVVLKHFRQQISTNDQRPWLSVDIEGSGGQPNIVGVAWKRDEAWVMKWGPGVQLLLNTLFKYTTPVLHNAAYDVPELEEAGVTPPERWVDTINMAACYMQVSGMLNLQSQVLSFVPGSIAWKRLIDHKRGPEYAGGDAGYYRGFWTDVLTALERNSPTTGEYWYQFYNGLDTAWTLALAEELKARLEGQGRWGYYTGLMQDLQRPLLEAGARGLPRDPAKIARHKRACLRLERMAEGILKEEGLRALIMDREGLIPVLNEALKERDLDKEERGAKKFDEALTKEVTAARNKLKSREESIEEGFNVGSNLQKCILLYDYLGLPVVKVKGVKGRSSKDTAVEALISRLERGTIKAKNVEREEALRILKAMMAGSKWGHWRRTFLER